MKIPVKWLADYVDLKGITDAELSNGLTMSGTENEIAKGIDYPMVVVGEIKEISDHPDADRLHVTKTDVGKANGGVLQIVCGAPNIEVGQKVPVALVGAVLGEFEIAKAKIRGVESYGMLCSESELGISDDHSGIMILDPRAKVGAPLAEALNIGGTVLEAEITPNRSDCFSMIGIAGEAAACLNRKMQNRNFKKAEVKSKQKVEVKVTEKNLCPRYIAKVIEGIKIGPSPEWMQERLEACGVRPINNVVDVTNYVMLEWGQPMHAFDMAKISGGISVRLAKKGEEIETLDGTKRKLTEKDLVIADAKKAIALAGVMGGANSEVTDVTKNIVLEAAVFEGTGVRKTAQRLGLRTEASNRFEKGVPLTLPELAVERAAGLLGTDPSRGRTLAGANTDVLSSWIWVQHVGLRLSRVKDFLGADISKSKVEEILESLGFEAEEFDFKAEARKHVGKPYAFGASFKTHGDMAFDCSYLTDYVYGKIGRFIGHTALAQFEIGKPVELADLQPGDILFVKGVIEKSATDHYFIPDGKGGHKKVSLEAPKQVGHCGIYLGGGRIIHARQSVWDEKKGGWKKLASGTVIEEDVSVFTKNPEYLGARRFVESPTGWLAATAPWWRLDVKIEEDLLEEIGRIYGFENIPGKLPAGNLPVPEKNQNIELATELKNILCGAGYSEVYNYSFISGAEIFAVGTEPKEALKIANPISPEQEYMRTTLAPSILKNLATNQFNFEDVKVFEIASVYLPKEKSPLPQEKQMLGVGVRIYGKAGSVAFFEIKGAIELIAKKLNLGKILAKEVGIFGAGEGQAAEIFAGKKRLGKIFIPNPKLRQRFGLKTEVAVAMFDVAELGGLATEVVYSPVARFPQVVRDVNLLFDKKTKAAQIDEFLTKNTGGLIRRSEITDIYEGVGLPAGKKSVTIRLVLGANDSTLTEDQINSAQNQIVLGLQKSLGGALRS